MNRGAGSVIFHCLNFSNLFNIWSRENHRYAVPEGPFAGSQTAIYLLWRFAICGVYHLCPLSVDGGAGEAGMEGPLLDNPAVHLRQCGGEEFSSGGKGAAAVLLLHSRRKGFHARQAALQCP